MELSETEVSVSCSPGSGAVAPTLGQELSRLRASHGMSLRKLANLLGLRAHSGLVDYERDYRIPSVELLREYQRVLNADGDLLFRMRRAAMRDRQSRQVVSLLPVESDGEQAPAALRVIGAGTSGVVRAAAQRARNFAQDVPVPLEDELIDQILDETRMLARAYPRQPDVHLLSDLALAQDQLLTLLGRHQAPASAHRLYWIAAVLGGALAKASLEFGDPVAATTQAHAAYVCADRVDDDGLRGWVRGMQSQIAYWDGHPHRALRYAQHGTRLTSNATGTVTAFLPACTARAWAKLGDAEHALRCVEQAEQAWNRILRDDLDAIGGVCQCERPELCYLIADALSWLPDRTGPVQEYCEQAAAGYRDESAPDWDFAAATCVDILAALASIAGGAQHRAGTLLTPLLDIPVNARLLSIRQSMARAADGLRASSGELADLCDRLLSFAEEKS
jgi:transcriptional regulator with XRE-family HTH domain